MGWATGGRVPTARTRGQPWRVRVTPSTADDLAKRSCTASASRSPARGCRGSKRHRSERRGLQTYAIAEAGGLAKLRPGRHTPTTSRPSGRGCRGRNRWPSARCPPRRLLGRELPATDGALIREQLDGNGALVRDEAEDTRLAKTKRSTARWGRVRGTSGLSCAEATAWRGTPSATPSMGKLDSLTGRRPTAMGAARLGAELAGAKQMRKGQ